MKTNITVFRGEDLAAALEQHPQPTPQGHTRAIIYLLGILAVIVSPFALAFTAGAYFF